MRLSLEQFLKKVDAEMRSYCKNEPRALYEPMLYVIEAGGKRFRPRLLALSCQAAGGSFESCIHAAAAVELMHTFTLIHDDIMDQDDLRRGRPTVHRKWDAATAILAGDGLMTLAYRAMLRIRHDGLARLLDILTDGLIHLCEGQRMDKDFETSERVTLAMYEKMISCKTASLLRVACEMGVVLGGGGEKERRAAGFFAEDLGMAFQIRDDVLDILVNEEKSGKTFGSDVVRRKKTYLVIRFLEKASGPAKTAFMGIWNQPVTGRKEIEQIRSLLIGEGAVSDAEEAVRAYAASAAARLGPFRESEAKNRLKEMAARLAERPG